MSYTTGGTIEATDYNNFAGGTTANVSGQLNSLLATGKGGAGYGQTAVSNVSVGPDVTATQWTTLVNGVNQVLKHQFGAGFTNIGTYSAGQTIYANADISGNLTTAYTNRFNFNAQGATVTGSTFSPSFTLPNQLAGTTYQFTRTATFANADAARYFFNAGGQLNFIISSVTNNDGTSRSGSLVTLAATNFTSKKIGAGNAYARTGTGGTLNSDATTNSGYYSYTTSNVTLSNITSTTATYTSDNIIFYAKTNGTQGSNSDNGTIVSLSVDLTTGTQTGGFDDSVNITVNHRVDVIYPETTFLANTWGSVTIA